MVSLAHEANELSQRRLRVGPRPDELDIQRYIEICDWPKNNVRGGLLRARSIDESNTHAGGNEADLHVVIARLLNDSRSEPEILAACEEPRLRQPIGAHRDG